MAHSYTSCLIHYVFSTKERRKLILADVGPRLWAYIGGIARSNGFSTICVGGTEDHAHVLAAIPSTLTIAKCAQLIKGGSSKWMHDTFPEHKDVAWQEGYGAFSIGQSGVERTISYIENQAEHHRTQTFEQEFKALLERYRIEFDEKYVFG